MSEHGEAQSGQPSPSGGTSFTTRSLVSLIAASGSSVRMILGGVASWRTEGGYTFIPVEFPGGACPVDAEPGHVVSSLARRWLGCEAQPLSSPASYGPSAAHRVDRLPDGEHPMPLVRAERFDPPAEHVDADATAPQLVRVLVRAYLVRVEGEPQPTSETAGVLTLPLGALRQAVRGMPLADLVALPDVEYRAAAGVVAPESALVYVTGDYGERHLLRAVAKYGPEILVG